MMYWYTKPEHIKKASATEHPVLYHFRTSAIF